MNDQNSIAVGDIQFLDNSIPALTSGQYLIDVTHTITDTSYGINTPFGAQQIFLVNGPRFALPPATVQSRFPVPNSQNDFHENLPFLIFNDQNLPWSRTLNGGGAPYPPSWLALMIFKPGEIIYTPPALPQQPNPTLSTIRPIADILNPTEGNTIGPAITLDDYELSLSNLSSTTIDVLGTTFQTLAPQLNELPYLAHLRQLNTGGQTIDGLNGNGYYSVLVGNRLPDPSATNKYTVHLVSMEGWENYLPGASNPQTFAAGQAARLISLDSWTFTSDPEGADFLELVDNLSITPLNLPLNPPQEWSAPAVVQTEITSRYTNGYVALNYTTRLGQNSFAWYRGPFNPTVPVLIENTLPGFTNNGDTPLTTSDEAIIYDQVNGVFDLSYSIAFETGKMLTLANKTASMAIWNWKRDGMQLLQILSNLLAGSQTEEKTTRFSARKNKTAVSKAIDWDSIRNDLLDAQAGHKKFVKYLSASLGKHFIADGKDIDSPVRICDPSKLGNFNDPETAKKHLPGLLSTAELEELTTTGKDPYVMIINKLRRG